MSNPFDDKLKQSLEAFEMPYDAGAWAELAKQLPPEGTVVGTEAVRFGWKGAAAIAVLVASFATVWYLSKDTEPVSEQVTMENVNTPEETVAVELPVAKSNTAPTQSASVRSESPSVSKSTVAETTTGTTIETSAEDSSPVQAMETKKPVDASPVQPKQSSASKPTVTAPKTEKKTFAAKFLPSSVMVCVGEEVNFINQSSNTKAKMNWDFGDGAKSSELNPNHSFVVPGMYQVRLNGSDADQSDDHVVSVSVNPSPSTDLIPTEKLVGYKAIPFYHFETTVQPNETATWKFSDGRTTNATELDHLFRDAGKVKVTLSVKNGFGCSATESWSLDNNTFDILAPTGFTPEGNSLNETFMPVALTLLNVPFEMVIRDQKGQEVYRTSNAQEPWNGRMHNTGEKLGAGIYVWSVVLKENICHRKDFNGPITIQR
jgi:PKD repeat protein